jgi:hypothetical protein
MAKETKPEDFSDIPHERKEPRPNLNEPYKHVALPKALDETLNDEEKMWKVMSEGKYVHSGLLCGPFHLLTDLRVQCAALYRL